MMEDPKKANRETEWFTVGEELAGAETSPAARRDQSDGAESTRQRTTGRSRPSSAVSSPRQPQPEDSGEQGRAAKAGAKNRRRGTSATKQDPSEGSSAPERAGDVANTPKRRLLWWERPATGPGGLPRSEDGSVHGPDESAYAPVLQEQVAIRLGSNVKRAKPVGFRHEEIVRVGESGILTPTGRVALTVTAQTPQRIRLGQITSLKASRSVIGRGRVACFVDDPWVAEFHAVIVYRRSQEETGFFLYTTPSAMTKVNGVAPEGPVKLESMDRIEVGDSYLVFLDVPLWRESQG